MSACCGPSREGSLDAGSGPLGGPPADLIALTGGETRLGSDDPDHPEEWPVRATHVAPYRIAACAVTNAEFAAYVAATAYVTDAERFGTSFVFGGLLPDDFPPTRGVAAAPWWREVEGADWAHPFGPQSSYAGLEDHPVVHVSRRDAEAYAGWRGARLPTEDEWEHAARGGLEQQPFPWGDELEPGGQHRMNVWQGTFPSEDTAADGWRGTCPVDEYPPNAYGLHNPTGNVWEWTLGEGTRGGSYLCHASYCRRYRVSARTLQTPDSSTGNLGFRLAADPA